MQEIEGAHAGMACLLLCDVALVQDQKREFRHLEHASDKMQGD